MAETLEQMKAQLQEIVDAQELTSEHLDTLNTAVTSITTDLSAIKDLVTELKNDSGPAAIAALQDAVTAVHDKAQAIAETTQAVSDAAATADTEGKDILNPGT